MKKILFLLSLVLLVASCRKESDRPILPLRLGEEDAKELQLTQSETRMLLLKGGDGKYTATIEDAASLPQALAETRFGSRGYSTVRPRSRCAPTTKFVGCGCWSSLLPSLRMKMP